MLRFGPQEIGDSCSNSGNECQDNPQCHFFLRRCRPCITARPSEAGRQGRPGPPHFSRQFFFFFRRPFNFAGGRERGARCYELRTLSRSYITACIGKWVRTTLSKWLRFACIAPPQAHSQAEVAYSPRRSFHILFESARWLFLRNICLVRSSSRLGPCTLV